MKWNGEKIYWIDRLEGKKLEKLVNGASRNYDCWLFVSGRVIIGLKMRFGTNANAATFGMKKSSSLSPGVETMLIIKCWLLWISLAPTVYWLLHWRHIAWRNRTPADDLDHLAFPRHWTTPMPSWDSFHCCHLSTDTESRVMQFEPSTTGFTAMIKGNPAMVSVERLAGWQLGWVRPRSIWQRERSG